MQPVGIYSSAALLWPALVAAEAGRLTSDLAQDLASLAAGAAQGSEVGSRR